MTIKICKICGKEKDISEFYIARKIPHVVYRTCCKECYLLQNKINEIKKKQRALAAKKYYYTHKEKIKEYLSRPDVKIKRNLNSKNTHERHKEKYKAKHNTLEYKIQHRRKSKEWQERNKKRLKEYLKNYYKNKYKSDTVYKLHACISTLIKWHLNSKNIYKCKKIEKLLGYTINDLKMHLEKQFEPWMNWNNHGPTSKTPKTTWQIDHIQPINTFNITSEDCEAFKKCWALENLRPLDSYENARRPKNGLD